MVTINKVGCYTDLWVLITRAKWLSNMYDGLPIRSLSQSLGYFYRGKTLLYGEGWQAIWLVYPFSKNEVSLETSSNTTHPAKPHNDSHSVSWWTRILGSAKEKT